MSVDHMTGPDLVLLAENQPLIRMAIVEALETKGFEVIEIADASEALAQLDGAAPSTSPRALLTDIEVPGGLNGSEIAWQIHQRSPGTAVLLVSGAARTAPTDLPPKASVLSTPTTPEGLVDSLYAALSELGLLPRY